MKHLKSSINTELISILMPVKNEEHFLIDCLESIINQNEMSWELIAVDDGSEDLSSEILNDFSRRDERIQFFTNEGTGIIDSLKTSYANCSGNYITRMDADDIMMQGKLHHLKSNLKDAGLGHVSLGCVKYFSDNGIGIGYEKYANWLNGLTKSGLNFSEIYKECVIPSPSWMVHRQDFDDCGGFEPNLYPEDYDLCFRFYKYGLEVIPSEQLVHLWRDYPLRTSRTDDHYSDNSFLEMKISYFLQIDYDKSKRTVVWGAGKKGKKVAKLLKHMNIEFDWICNNKNKIGKYIYGIRMQDSALINDSLASQILVLIASPKDQYDLKNNISLINSGHQLIYFC